MQPQLRSGSPTGQLEPGQRIDREDVRLDEPGHVADHDLGIAPFQQKAEALAQLPDIGRLGPTVDRHDDRASLAGCLWRSQSRPIGVAQEYLLWLSPPDETSSPVKSHRDEFAIPLPSYKSKNERDEETPMRRA